MISVTPAVPPVLPSELAARVEEVAAELLEDRELREDRERWRRERMLRWPEGLGVHLDDVSGIPFLSDILGVEWYQLRARLRARAGDVVVSAKPAVAGYEPYCAVRLGLGEARWVLAGEGVEVARRAWETPACFRELVELGRRRPLYLHPYMGFAAPWELAARLGRATGRPVPVLGPPPALCALANDKIRFLDLVRRVLGPEAVVDCRVSADPAELARQLGVFARRYPKVGLKMPCCASAMGNRVFDGESLRGVPKAALRNEVQCFLGDKEWDGREPVQVVRWEDRVLQSPSVQLWIPPEAEGGVICEGVFRQRFLPGDECIFEGAVPTNLPEPVWRRFAVQATAVGGVLQRLGYVGRCSFDAVLVGERPEAASFRFVECNGRWGGTSTPMSFLNRLFGDYRKLHYVSSDVVEPAIQGMGFPEFLRLLEDELWGDSSSGGWLIVYNVGCIRDSGKFDAICLGASRAEAEARLHVTLPRLLRAA